MNRELRSIFSLYHPSVQLLYLVAVLFCAMFTLRPLYVILSFLAGSLYSIFLNGIKQYLKGLRILLIMFTIITILNPITNSRGSTELFELFGKPFTLESLIYGLCSGGMLVSIFVWFQCYQALITNDKFMFLFGRIAPTTAMVISMIMNFVPMTVKKYHEIAYAQKGMESLEKREKKKRIDKIRNSIRQAGILMSRCMEDSIETADAMRARGYGVGRRTHFSTFILRKRDFLSLILIGGLFVFAVISIAEFNEGFSFFPTVTNPTYDLLEITKIILYVLLLIYPLIIEAKDVWIKESLMRVN